MCGCSSRGCRRSLPRSPAGRFASSGTGRLRSPAGRRHGGHGRPAAVRLRAEERGAHPDLARQARRERAGPAAGRRGHAPAAGGRVGLRDRRIALQASGDANLGILQGFFRDVLGSGRAELTASVDGPLDAAGVFRQRVDYRRPRPPPVDAQRARRHQRHHPVRPARHPPRRGDGAHGRGPGAVRRPDRVRRLPAGRTERHGARPRTCTSAIPRASGPSSMPICPSAATSGRRRSAGW